MTLAKKLCYLFLRHRETKFLVWCIANQKLYQCLKSPLITILRWPANEIWRKIKFWSLKPQPFENTKPLTFLKMDCWKSLTCFFFCCCFNLYRDTYRLGNLSVELLGVSNCFFASAEVTKVSRAEVGAPANLYWGSRKWVEIIILFTLVLLKHFVNDSLILLKYSKYSYLFFRFFPRW